MFMMIKSKTTSTTQQVKLNLHYYFNLCVCARAYSIYVFQQ